MTPVRAAAIQAARIALAVAGEPTERPRVHNINFPFGVTPETPVFRDPDALIYGREEVGGLLVGCFDRNAKPLPVEALPDDFAFGLWHICVSFASTINRGWSGGIADHS